MVRLLFASLLAGLCACPEVQPALDAGAPPGGPLADAGVPSCQLCSGEPVKRGTVGEAALAETSGLVASRAHPGVLYAHNDSGDSARFFALSDTGAPLGEFRLPGATATDWEDLALGPCPTGTCLYLGDIGDNRELRTNYALYRVPEPAVEASQPAGTVDVSFERLPFTYPGNAKHNAETLLVHPSSGEVYVITKRPAGLPSAVFRFPQPLTPGTSATLHKVADLPIPFADDLPLTGGDLHPCGAALLLRTYFRLYLLRPGPDAAFETIFTSTPIQLPLAAEEQGEAVGWSASGRGFFTTSEGAAQPLWYAGCQ